MKSRLCIHLTNLVIAIVLACPAHADDYASQYDWRFHNFDKSPLSWDRYRDTFIGIPPTEDPFSSAFDVLFYDQVYKTQLTKGDGNCFGMSLLNLMIQQNGGCLGVCAPVTQYSGDPNSSGGGPTDPNVRWAINVMHGHQVNLPTIQFFVNIFAQHLNRNAANAVDQFNYYQSRGDLTLVSITKDLNPSDDGHTLIAYRVADQGGGNKKMFVLDPNWTWANPSDQEWYKAESNFIQITNDHWSYDGGLNWSGDPGSGGNIVITPISVTGPMSRSPASLGDSIIGEILNTLLLTGDGARVEQVTDAQGKRLYKPGTLEFDADPASGMTNIIPWFFSDRRTSYKPEARGVVLFQLGSSGGALRFSVSAGKGGYTLTSMGRRTIVSVTARGGSGTDALTIRNPGTFATSVSLENQRGASDYDVAITRVRVPRTEIRVLSASALHINGDGPTEVGLANNGEALQISSEHASLRYDLTLSQVTRKGREDLTRSEVSQDPGAARVVQPQSWQQLKGTQVVEQWHPLVPH